MGDVNQLVKIPLPTARELDALKVLWRLQQASVRDIYLQLLTANPNLAYTTVLSLIQTMEKKGFVRRDGHGRGLKHLYRSNVSPERTLRELASEFLDRVFDGAVSQYLVSALESKPPNEKQLLELEKMISAAKKRRK